MLLMTGQTVSQIGSVMGSFGFLLLTFAVTGSPSQSGLASAAFVLGMVLALLHAGALADRRDRKKVMVASSAIGALPYASVVVAYDAGVLTFAHLVVVALAEGVVTAFFRPSEQAALPRLVEQRGPGGELGSRQPRVAAASRRWWVPPWPACSSASAEPSRSSPTRSRSSSPAYASR